MKRIMYKITWDNKLNKDLHKLDKKTKSRIVQKVEKYLVLDPLGLGEPLYGRYIGLWRYRVGNYRVIYDVSQETITITVVKVGHRSDIYQAK